MSFKAAVYKKSSLRNIFICGLAFILFFLPGSGWANPPPIPASENQAPAYRENEISVSREGVRIEVLNGNLRELMQRIREKSGIDINYSYALGLEPVTANILAPDWQVAMNQLLEDFSKVEIWDDEGNLVLIRLMGRNLDADLGFPDTETSVAELNPEILKPNVGKREVKVRKKKVKRRYLTKTRPLRKSL